MLRRGGDQAGLGAVVAEGQAARAYSVEFEVGQEPGGGSRKEEPPAVLHVARKRAQRRAVPAGRVEAVLVVPHDAEIGKRPVAFLAVDEASTGASVKER